MELSGFPKEPGGHPKKNEADLEQAKEKQVTELYVKAIGQLGSDKLPVILGGI
jgi:hypothetical protein